MSAGNIFNNTTFQIVNETVVNSEPMYVPICLELLNIILLTTFICVIYFGIEISHPVYAVLFCNLVIALASSLTNVLIFPVLKNINYTNLLNGNSVVCLLFHICSWCILSVLRYLYIIHKSWIEEKFPKPVTFLLWSIFGVFYLFVVGLSATGTT
jgi:hypothetical protein